MDEEETHEEVIPSLPVGTVVMLQDSDHPVIIAGLMAVDGLTGLAWDYLAYPYPEGRQDAAKDYFFDESQISEVLQFGYTDKDALAFQGYLAENGQVYLDMRAQQSK
jgi:hypothetical protein